MTFKALEKQRELHRIQFLTAVGVCFYWPLHYIFQAVSPELIDDLGGRISISILSSLILVFSRKADHSELRLRFYVDAAITLVVIHMASLLVLNNWDPSYKLSYLVMTVALSTTAIRFNDYIWVSVMAIVAPCVFSITSGYQDLSSVVYFTLSNTAVLFFVGNAIRNTFRYKSDLKRASENSNKNAKLAALGQMASGMAHEINTPLSVIKGKSDQILMRTVSDAPVDREWLRAELAKIGSTVEKIARIVRGLKSFARNSEQDPFAELKVETWLQHTLELCRERLHHNQISLEVGAIPQVAVMARESQLIQVLLNLLNNSIDALENSPSKKISLRFETNEELLSIFVTDTGPGIPKENLPKIAEAFFTTKPPGKGTGLGLSISRGIMESHQGKLNYVPESTETCFCIQIPLATVASGLSKAA